MAFLSLSFFFQQLDWEWAANHVCVALARGNHWVHVGKGIHLELYQERAFVVLSLPYGSLSVSLIFSGILSLS